MNFTKEQIENLKKEHGQIFVFKAESGESCILRKPTRKELSYASMAGQNDPIKFSELILNGCWLVGDEQIKTDDELFMGVSQLLGDMIKIKSFELEKL